MKEDITTKERSIMVPFLVGGIVGAALGLLLAPKPGREMRKQIKDFAVDSTDAIASAVRKGKDLYADTVTAVNSAIDAGKRAYIQEREKIEMQH
jgi:gas vesicle protein